MDSLPVVRNIDGLLAGVLKPSEKIIDRDISRLTAPGDNYGSIMLRIALKIKDTATGTERILDTVGKCVPDSEKIQEVFNTKVTYKSEYNYYATIIPLLDTFLKSKGLSEGADFAAPFYGGRINLNNGDSVDNDAIILLANLRTKGYVTGKKTIGLDVPSIKCAFDSLAKFHAAGIGYKLQNRESFERDFRPHFYSFIPDYITKVVLMNLKHTLKNNSFAPEEIERALAAYNHDSLKKDVSDTWGTMIHYDTWTNNILIKYEDSKPVHSVLVDFQVFEYGTPLNDVMFFLFTSLRHEVFDKHFDEVLDYYYETLLGSLKKLSVDTRAYNRASFDAEVKIAVQKYEYLHAMWMLEPLMHESFKSVEDIAKMDSLLDWSPEHIRRITSVTRLCLTKGWI